MNKSVELTGWIYGKPILVNPEDVEEVETSEYEENISFIRLKNAGYYVEGCPEDVRSKLGIR